MPFNGSGTYETIGGGDFPAVDGTTIRADQYNNQINDIATALSNCVTRDGQSPPTQNLPMGAKRVTGLGDAVDAQDAVTKTQLDARFAAISGRNTLINGNFAINQDGVSGTVVLAAGAYGHDGWKAGSSGCTYTFATSANVTTLTITAGSLQQVIEGTSLLTGTYVMSWTGTAQGKIGAGSYSASGVTGSVTGGSSLTVEFGTGTLAKVQLESGSTATEFELLEYGTDLARCQRYYYTIPANAAWMPAVYFSSPRSYQFYLRHPVPMRAAPTVTAGTFEYRYSGTITDGTAGAVSASSVLDLSFELSCPSAPDTYGTAILVKPTTAWKFSARL